MFWAPASKAQDLVEQEKVKQIWQLLDYVAVDYRKAVVKGQIASDDEFAEMQEFSQSVHQQLASLPVKTAQMGLVRQAETLRQLIAKKSSPDAVADRARKLSIALIDAYPVPMAPLTVPDTRRGPSLYQAHCASCHGAQGHGNGPLAASLHPPPVALTDHGRAYERSVFALQQIISNGIPGTAMPAFSQLSEDDRWIIAFFASGMSYEDAARESGKRMWETDQRARNAVPSLGALAQSQESELALRMPEVAAHSLLAYLRSHPEALAASSSDSLALAKARLADSLRALEQGDIENATRMALSAYLDGFEIVEPALAAKNKELLGELEQTMGAYRAAVGKAQLNEARRLEKHLLVLLIEAQASLNGSTNDPLSTFLGAFTILLREGLEALLVIVAISAFLKRAKRTEALPYVHAGWMTALAAGAATWAVATYLVDLTGASREMTEGFSAIFAAVVLLVIGIWMHQKSMAGRWQAYLQRKLAGSLNRRSAAMLFVLSFATVYREVFETVLFYAALWTGGNGMYMLAGLGSGVAVLTGIAILLTRTSMRLPIGKFFMMSSALMGILAIVLAGKGIAALQKAGLLGITPIAIPRIEILGIYPSAQPVFAQCALLIIIATSVALNLRSLHKT
jgi:high-affinity iron transporter